MKLLKRRTLQASALVLASRVAGCSYLPESKKIDYGTAAKAPPLENPTSSTGADEPTRRIASRTASRVAADQSSHSTLVRPPGTVPWPGRRMPSTT